jgi:hypothetical protein
LHNLRKLIAQSHHPGRLRPRRGWNRVTVVTEALCLNGARIPRAGSELSPPVPCLQLSTHARHATERWTESGSLYSIRNPQREVTACGTLCRLQPFLITPSPTLILNHLALSANGSEKAGIVSAIPQRAKRRWACDSGIAARISYIKFLGQKAKRFPAGSPCWHNWPPNGSKSAYGLYTYGDGTCS